MIGCEDSHDIANNNLSKWGVTTIFTGTWIEPQVYSLMQSLNLRMALKYVCLARNAGQSALSRNISMDCL